jgi:putative membrane protein
VEPDARFTFANERTFLAWHRTALALVVAGLAIVQFLPPFPGVPFGRHLLALPLILLGGVLSVGSYLEWTRHQRALRRGEPLGASMLPRLLAVAITVLSVAAGVLSLLAPAWPGPAPRSRSSHSARRCCAPAPSPVWW